MSLTKLSDQDRASAAWMRHKVQLEERLATLRGNNDHPLTPEATAYLRGQIAEIKLMLGLDKKTEPQMNVDPFTY